MALPSSATSRRRPVVPYGLSIPGVVVEHPLEIARVAVARTFTQLSTVLEFDAGEHPPRVIGCAARCLRSTDVALHQRHRIVDGVPGSGHDVPLTHTRTLRCNQGGQPPDCTSR